jgi:hypothetical protein
MNRSSVALTVVGLLVIVGLLVLAIVNDSGEAVLTAAGVAISGVLAAILSSRRRRPPRDQRCTTPAVRAASRAFVAASNAEATPTQRGVIKPGEREWSPH